MARRNPNPDSDPLPSANLNRRGNSILSHLDRVDGRMTNRQEKGEEPQANAKSNYHNNVSALRFLPLQIPARDRYYFKVIGLSVFAGITFALLLFSPVYAAIGCICLMSCLIYYHIEKDHVKLESWTDHLIAEIMMLPALPAIAIKEAAAFNIHEVI